MLPPDLSPDDRRLVDSLLGPWEEAVERGEKPRPESICPDRPDLWAAIVARAAQLEQMAFLDGERATEVRPGHLLAGPQRLREEGERLANFSHPHIVQVFDAGVEDQIAFVVQELVTGDTLADRIEGGPPPPRPDHESFRGPR